MFSASVAATRYVLCAADHACFASSLTVTTAAPTAMPPPSTSSCRLLLLFLTTGRVAASTLLANVLRCCLRVWPCDWRHVRHVHGAVPLRRATSDEPWPSTGAKLKADMTDTIRSWYLGSWNENRLYRYNVTEEKRRTSCNGHVVVLVADPTFSRSRSRYRTSGSLHPDRRAWVAYLTWPHSVIKTVHSRRTRFAHLLFTCYCSSCSVRNMLPSSLLLLTPSIEVFIAV